MRLRRLASWPLGWLERTTRSWRSAATDLCIVAGLLRRSLKRRLIAHRELQQIRAGRTNKRKYVNERGVKLAEARARLERHQLRLRQVDETPVCCLLGRGYSQ